MTPTDYPPSGCHHCGLARRLHVQRWTDEAGWHKFTEPSRELIAQRMRAKYAPAPPCPGGPQYPHARAAKSHAWATEPDRSKRPVAVECDGHWHLAARAAAPDPGGLSAATPTTTDSRS